jgi:hypothetical protein
MFLNFEDVISFSQTIVGHFQRVRTLLHCTSLPKLIAYSLLASGEFSDLAIKCNLDLYKVHKNIVITRSSFFARAVRFGGKVGVTIFV